jgi:hypothetical protein
MTGEVPDVSTLRVFGSPCKVKLRDRQKQEFKDALGVFLGFDFPNSKAYKVLTSEPPCGSHQRGL